MLLETIVKDLPNSKYMRTIDGKTVDGITSEEKQLKEAIKILLRDGKNGKFFEVAKTRYLNLKTPERINNLSHEIDGIDWSKQYKQDIDEIDKLIR